MTPFTMPSLEYPPVAGTHSLHQEGDRDEEAREVPQGPSADFLKGVLLALDSLPLRRSDGFRILYLVFLSCVDFPSIA